MKKYLVVLLFLAMPSLAFGLAIEYLRNGECYLLIGHSDVGFRGVYRLNNPSGETDGNPVGVKLFDPKTSYGISVDLARKVYTFSENKAPTFVLGTWQIRRLLKAPGGVGLWGAHCDTRKSYYVSNENITYNQANRPVYTTTGPMGSTAGNLSNDPQNVSWLWSGVVKPTVKEPGRWYFQKTHVSCHTNCKYTNGYSDAFWLYFVPVDGAGYGNIPNNSWWQSRDKDPHGRPGNLFYWDRVYRKYTYYDLNMWNKPMGIWSAGNPIYGQYAGVADSVYDEIIQRSRISACLNCVCVNGSGDQNFSAVPKFVSLAMSPFGRMYLYSRTDHPSALDGEVRLNGTAMSPTAPNIRGNVNDLTTKWVGISAASKTEEYIYLLGTNLIKAWLDQYNIKPPTLDITSVTVSDQWWLDGGIVYAYDAIEGAAYKFIRFDKAGNDTCKSIPQKISIGTGVDAIKADGFGNLYFAKTTMTPALASSIDWSELYTFNFYQVYGGRAYAHAYYRQKVFKTVFCQENGATGNYQVGKIHIGNNIFRRSFSVPETWYTTVTLGNIQTKSTDPGWAWQGARVMVSGVTDPSLTQLGVINVATPPNPTGNSDGMVDIVGIEDIDPAFKFATDEVNQGMYKFRIENSPYWEGRNNIATDGKTKWEGDKNGNGHFGGFISSIMNTSASVDSSPQLLYTWRIYKIQDAFGTPLVPAQLVKEFVDSPSAGISYYFRSGTYQIMCSAKFKWYDYNLLPFGSTVDDINSCIRPSGGMKQALAAPKDAAINATVFPGLTAIPADSAVTMLRVNRQVPLPTGKKLDIQRRVAGVWTDPKTFGTLKYHVVFEDEVNQWRLKPDPKDPPTDYLHDLYNLPVINNNNMVPNTLVWQNNMAAQYEWTLSLTLPDGTIYPAQELSKDSSSQYDATIAMAQEFPTDPVMGKLLCKAYRNWEYLENVYDGDGNYIGQEKREGKIEYSGEVDVLVLDKTPPKIIAVNNIPISATSILNPALLGQTGGLAIEAYSIATYTNPASFSILVEDNNIYANMNILAPVEPVDRQHNRGTNQQGTFFFERGAGKALFPNTPGTAVFKHYSSPGAALVPDITTTWTKHPEYRVMRKPLPYQYGDTSSYILYVFEVSDLNHLQDGTPGDIMSDPARWPINLANNSPSYMGAGNVGAPHPGYGLMFQPTDSSGKVGERTHFGNVWIVDTLLPIVYSRTTDYIKSFEEAQPFGIENYLVAHPKSGESGFPNYGVDPLPAAATWQTKPDSFPWYGRLPNDIAVWTVQADGKYPALNDLLGIPPGLNAKMGIYHPPIIQEGVEMFMEAFASDNIAVSNTVLPTINIQGPSGLYTEGNPPQINESSGNLQKIRLLLQKSGVYDVTLTAEDNALTFFGAPAPNRRTIRFGLVVGPTTMEIRVIDKKNTGF